jgi:4-hydroxybenzoate polyprenyltransferase
MQARALRLGEGLRLAASVSRLHIVVIAGLGTFTFGWVLTGQRGFLVAAVSALDWFLVNLLNRVVDQREDQANAVLGADFAARHRRAILVVGFAVLLLSFPALFLVVPRLTAFRAAYHALGLCYNWPLLPGRRRVKQLYFWKNTASAMGFMLTVFAYPLAAAWRAGGLVLAPDITAATIVAAGIFFFLFELSYEVIYDLRDAEGDRLAGVRTYPVAHGERAAVHIVDALLGGAIATLAVGLATHIVPWRLFIMICAPLMQLGLYKRALRRGLTAGDCIGLTWLGALLLLSYHLWVLLKLPGAELP